MKNGLGVGTGRNSRTHNQQSKHPSTKIGILEEKHIPPKTKGIMKMSSSKEELEYYIQKHQLTDPETLKKRPLTRQEVLAMETQVYEWHLLHNEDNLNAALEEPKRKTATEKRGKKLEADLMWGNLQKNPYDPIEELRLSLYRNEQDKFLADHPQVVPGLQNAESFARFFISRSLEPGYDSCVLALQELGSQGSLTLNPSAIGAGSETEISGEDLQRHPNLDKLLEKYTPKTPEQIERDRLDGLSADQYYKEAKILHPTQMSPLALRDIQVATASFMAHRPDFAPGPEAHDKIVNWLVDHDAELSPQSLNAAFEDLVARGELKKNPSITEEATVMRYTDYGEASGGGHPEYFGEEGRQSFRVLVANLTADELQNRMANPVFRRQVDALGS
jgi:hypothetical protein